MISRVSAVHREIEIKLPFDSATVARERLSGLGARLVRDREFEDNTLFDRETDPLEWTNLADKPEHAETKKQLAAWLPKVNAENAPAIKRKKWKKKRKKNKKKAALAPQQHPLRLKHFGPPEPIRSMLG